MQLRPIIVVAALQPSLVAASRAGLLWVSDTDLGWRRRRRGSSFLIIGENGVAIRDANALARIRALAIPPAWTDVWICPDEHGHIQATGRDARGRKQYRYHARWREVRDEVKYSDLVAFGRALPAIRRRVAADLALPGIPREKVLAALVRLLELTLIRIGNDEYARANRSYGLTTLRDQHVKFEGAKIRFSFRGKSGIARVFELRDPRLARVVQRCQDLPGQILFQYEGEDGVPHRVTSGDVNDYLREISGTDFTAKYFRTWGGTLSVMCTLAGLDAPETAREAKRIEVAAIKRTAELLGNTAAVCRKSYVHPAVLEAYRAGKLGACQGPRWSEKNLSGRERALLNVLSGSRVANTTSKQGAIQMPTRKSAPPKPTKRDLDDTQIVAPRAKSQTADPHTITKMSPRPPKSRIAKTTGPKAIKRATKRATALQRKRSKSTVG